MPEHTYYVDSFSCIIFLFESLSPIHTVTANSLNCNFLLLLNLDFFSLVLANLTFRLLSSNIIISSALAESLEKCSFWKFNFRKTLNCFFLLFGIWEICCAIDSSASPQGLLGKASRSCTPLNCTLTIVKEEFESGWPPSQKQCSIRMSRRANN